MRRVRCSNGVKIVAYVGDGFDGGSGVFVDRNTTGPEKPAGEWGHLIPHRDLPKVIRLLAWYEKAEMELRHSEGKMWRHIFEDDNPALPTVDSPYLAAFYRGHLESHLRKCGCKKHEGRLQ